jgi:hypothetical protein
MYGLPDSIGGYYAKRYLKSLKYMRGGGGRGFIPLVYSTYRVRLYKARLRTILNTPAGKLWWALERRGNAIVRSAKRQVGVKTGALRTSIHMRHSGNATGQYLWIGSKKNYAYLHHEGTKPHTITAKDSPVLVFRSGSRIIKTPTVNHPGTRANRYLTTPMRTHLVRPILIR